MFLGGLWHGASWNFVIWGLLHGTYLAVHKMITNKFPSLKNHVFFKTKVGIIFSIIITQYLVFLSWIPFRVHDFESLLYSMQKYIILDFQTSGTLDIILHNRFEVGLIVLFFLLHFISYKKGNFLKTIADLKLRYWIIFLLSIMLLIFFFFEGNPEEFIYFQFWWNFMTNLSKKRW